MRRDHIYRILRIFVVLVIGVLLWSCQDDDSNMQFIQGTWINLNAHLQKETAESHLETTWTFSGNRYRMSACCFVNASEQGTFHVLESDDGLFVLELRTTSGHLGGMAMSARKCSAT